MTAIEILTPPGRIVWGHPLEKGIKTDPKTRKAILGKDGKEQDVWSFGLAIPVAQFAAVEAAIAQAAYQQYPQGNFPRDFAWKIKRETDLDEQNKPYAEREGYAGCVVLSCSTQAFCPPVYKFENGQYRQLTEKEMKCGDWVVAKLSINGHPGGVYINPVAVELIGYDKEIVRRNAANPNETFGGRQYQLPAGVSATPIGGAPVGVGMPQAVQQPQAMMMPQAAPMPQQMAYPAAVASQPMVAAPVMAQPVAMPAPAHDFVQNAISGQPQYQPQAMPQQYGIPAAAPQAVGHPPAMVGIPQGR